MTEDSKETVMDTSTTDIANDDDDTKPRDAAAEDDDRQKRRQQLLRQLNAAGPLRQALAQVEHQASREQQRPRPSPMDSRNAPRTPTPRRTEDRKEVPVKRQGTNRPWRRDRMETTKRGEGDARHRSAPRVPPPIIVHLDEFGRTTPASERKHRGNERRRGR